MSNAYIHVHKLHKLVCYKYMYFHVHVHIHIHVEYMTISNAHAHMSNTCIYMCTYHAPLTGCLVEPLGFKEEDWVRVSDGGQEKAFGLAGTSRNHNLYMYMYILVYIFAFACLSCTCIYTHISLACRFSFAHTLRSTCTCTCTVLTTKKRTVDFTVITLSTGEALITRNSY